MSNAWVIYPQVGDNSGKPVLIPNVVLRCISGQLKVGILRNLPLGEEPAYDQLVGEVTLTKATTVRRPERVIGHTGTETLPRLLREAAVEDHSQCAKA